LEPFASDHLLVIAGTAIAALALGLLVRRSPGWPGWRVAETGIALVLVAAVAYHPIEGLLDGTTTPRDDLPLHASEVVALVAALALLTRRQLAFELVWFWGLTGGIAALLTPDLSSTFPSPGWWVFVLAHSLTIVAAIELALGRRMAPRPFSSLAAAAGAVLLLVVAGTASAATGGNYMYTREPPGAGTPLDAMAGWPWYLLGGALIALVAFVLLELPFRSRGRGAGRSPRARRPPDTVAPSDL